ncbi:MAG: UDP-N-acetylglucosamine 2-epimerase (non-hydrolyzing), partial [Alphaproteobacteria bacterium]|nr:UDP-N-acetylglucosamine 2-epimerase (non-hydrolyzing) [Alphaproteobacteria bacterium]
DAHHSAAFEKQFSFLDASRKLILVTAHRRESFGEGIVNICEALLELSARSDIQIVYPVHPNPNIKKPVSQILGSAPNVTLIEPQDYLPFVYLMDRSTMILTDSGGIQEEAPALGKPVLVMRDTNERPEAVAAGTVAVIGTGKDAIVSNTQRVLDDAETYRRFARAQNPYGDGRASQRIVTALLKGTIAPEAQFHPFGMARVAAE